MHKICSVMLVDSNRDYRDMLRSGIDAEPGLCVAAALGSAAEALDFVQRETPDLVVTELMLPDMDGISLLRSLRALCPSASMVVLTGFCSEQAAREAAQLGVAAYLAKPCALSVIIERLHDVCSGGSYVDKISTLLGEKEAVGAYLHAFGISPHLRGYEFTYCALLLECVRSAERSKPLMREVYEQVAEICGSTAANVERSMRHAINQAWKSVGRPVLERYFGRKKPSCRELVTVLSALVYKRGAEQAGGQ